MAKSVVVKGLYPPGPGYTYSKAKGGWVKAKPTQKAAPEAPKYVATAYEDRTYTPSESKGAYKEEAAQKKEAAADKRRRAREAAQEKLRARAQSKIWAAEQTIMPWETDVFGPKKPKKPKTFAEAAQPEPTWQQKFQAEEAARKERARQASALPGTKEREEFVRGLSPERRRQLTTGRVLPQPRPKPWEPNLSPFTSRIPGAREGMQIGHWAEGLLGRQGAVTKEVMASPGQVSDVGRAAIGLAGRAGKAYLTGDTQPALDLATRIYDKTPTPPSTRAEFRHDAQKLLDLGKAATEGGWAVYQGVNKAAWALLVKSQEILSEVDPEQQKANRREIRATLEEGRGAQTAREFWVGPNLSKYLEGGPMTPWAWAEFAMLVAPGVGWTPARPAIAGAYAGIKGVRSIPQGGRFAVKQAAKEWNRIQPVRGLESAERGQGNVSLLLGLKPEPAWRTPFSTQLGLKGVAAKSRFGQLVQNTVIDPARKMAGRDVQYGATQLRKSEVIQRRITEWPGKRLEKAAKSMDVEESYAIRALASGVPPMERAAWHRAQGQAADGAMEKYVHTVHAELNDKAMEYVTVDFDGNVILRPDAPRKLKEAWGYYQAAYKDRERIYTTMDELADETVRNRLQVTGKIMRGGKWIENEDWANMQLATSEKRGQVVEEAYKLIDAGLATPDQITRWMEVIDGQARSWVERETLRSRRRATYLKKKIARTDDPAKQDEYLMQLEEVQQQLADGLQPDAYFDDLDRVITGPGRAIWPMIFGADHDKVSFFAALKHWSDETVDKRLASKLDEKKFHKGLAVNPTIERNGFAVAGEITPESWLARVKTLIPTQQEQAYWAEWYEDFADAFSVFGEDALPIMRGFAASQANQAPAGGITSVLKVMDRHRRGEKVTSEGIGMVAKAVSEAVRGSELEKGVAAKLSDFADALAGRTTRTWMGGKPEGGAPAPADVWAARDLGYVDRKHAKRLVKEFDLVEGTDFIVDSPGAPSGLRYERISEQYQAIAEHLNKKKFHGRKDWTPAQVQALGWATAQKMVGVDPEDLAFALQRNSRSIDFELTQGPLALGGGLSPEQVHAVAVAVVPEIRRLIEDTPGVYFRDMKMGISGWAEGQNGSVHVDVIGSERDIQNLLSRFARAFDQEYVQASREITKAGAKAALAIGSESFADETVKVAFFKRLHELAPEIPMLDDAGNVVKENGKIVKEKELSGYMPGDVGGMPGMIIRTGKGYVGPSTTARFLNRFKVAIETVEEEMGIDVQYGAKNLELLIGSQYGQADRFSRAGSTGGLASLDDPLEAAVRRRLSETLDDVRRGEQPGATDSHRYLAAGRDSELGIPHAQGDTLDDIIEFMGANDRPHVLAPTLDDRGWGVGPPRVADVVDAKLGDAAAGEISVKEAMAQPDVYEPIGGFKYRIKASIAPPRWLYRAISEEEWKGIKDAGVMRSDGRMNLTETEGTVTSLDDPRFYLPGKLRSDEPGTYYARIVRIRYRDEDGWRLDRDSYVKTDAEVPIEQIDMVSPPLQGERGTRFTLGGQEVPTFPVYKPVRLSGLVDQETRRMMEAPRYTDVEGLDEFGRFPGEHTDRFQWLGESDFAKMSDTELKEYADWAETYGDKLAEAHEHPDIYNELFHLAGEARRNIKFFAPGEGVHELKRTKAGDELLRRLLDEHPENIKDLWDLDPQDSIAVTLNLNNAPKMTTIERAKDAVRDQTWEYLNREHPDGVVTLYRGGRRQGGEEGLIPWTTRYELALKTYAKGDPAAVRTRTVNIGEIEAALPAFPQGRYSGFPSEKEYLLWGDDTRRFMQAGQGGHASSYGKRKPTNPAVEEALRNRRHAVSGVTVTNQATNRSFIALSDRLGTPYTVGHEFFHYLETQLSPHETRILREGLGDDPEDIVMGWTTWALMGGGGTLAPVFQKLSDSVISDLASLGFSSANVHAIPRQVVDLLDALHSWDELSGGAIRGAEFSAGKAKEPFYPGMPLSLRQKYWDFHKFSRAQSMSISGRGPIGKQWSDPTTTKQIKGTLLQSGMFEADVTRGALREYFKALKLDSTARVRGVLIKAAQESPNGGKIPQAATDYAIKLDPDKTTSSELKVFFDLISDIDSGETIESAIVKGGRKKKIGLRTLENTHEDALQHVINEMYPNQIDGVDIKKIAAEMLDGRRGEIPNILWVPKELVENSHIFEPPSLQKAKRSSYAGILRAGVFGVDALNDLFRTSLLLLNPAYYPMNLIGNLVMNFLQQGPFALYNLPRAARLSWSMSPDSAHFIDNLMGEGWSSAAQIKTSLVKNFKISPALAQVANVLVDRIPRRAAWLHEAMRAGYRTPDELEGLLSRAIEGDSAARETIELITRMALDEMVDFDNLTPLERDFFTRIIFVYPWLKGSTVYTLKFPMNHPVQAAAFAYLYERQQAVANNQVGERPDYLNLFFPFTDVERYGEKYPYGFSLRQMFTMSTTYDIFNSFYGYARGDVSASPLTEYLQPLYGLALSTATGYDPFLDKKVDRGLFPFLIGLGKSFTTDSPGVQNIQKLLQSEDDRRRHAEEGRLYPRNRMDDILRVVFGSLAPGPVNPKTAGKRAREGQAASTEEKILDWTDEAKELTGEAPSIEYTTYKAAEYRYNEIQSDIRKEEGTSDLTDAQLTEAKMRVYLEAHPEDAAQEVQWTAWIKEAATSDKQLDKWNDFFSKALGWDKLNEYERYVKKHKDYQEKIDAAAAK